MICSPPRGSLHSGRLRISAEPSGSIRSLTPRPGRWSWHTVRLVPLEGSRPTNTHCGACPRTRVVWPGSPRRKNRPASGPAAGGEHGHLLPRARVLRNVPDTAPRPVRIVLIRVFSEMFPTPRPGRWETCCSAAVARAPLPEHAFSECSAWAAGREQLWPRARVLCPRAARSESSPSREQLVCSVRGQLAESSPGREQLCPRAARGQLPRAALSESGSARERTERGRVSSGRRRSVTSSRTS